MHARFLQLTTAMAIGAIALGMSTSAAARVRKINAPATFPYVIAQPGSYILNENLVVPGVDTNAIEVHSDNVTIDLNGFTIKGPVVCTTPTACAPTSNGIGILATGHDNVRVINGTVRGMLDAVRLTGAMERVEDVTAVSNSGIGIYIGAGIIADCIVALNGEQGVWAFANDSRIRDCIAIDNGQQGFDVDRAIVTDSVAVNNLHDGIRDEGGGLSQFTGNVTNDNGHAGLYTDNSVVLGNVAIDNGGLGLDCVDCAYGFNYLTGNNLNGTQGPFSSIQVGGNACGGDAVCP